MTSDTIWQLVRYALLAIGGYFTNKGVITGDQLTSIIATVGTIFTALWGLYVKFGTKTTTIAVAARPDVPVVSAATGKVTS